MNSNIDFKTLQNTTTMAERKTRSGKVFKPTTNTLPEISSQDEDDMDGDLEAEMEEEEIRLKAKKSPKKQSNSNGVSPAKAEKKKYKKNYGIAKEPNPELK